MAVSYTHLDVYTRQDKMRPLFRTLDGGLFSEKAGKADGGDAVSKLQAEGGTLMCWADPFYPDRVIPQKVLERSVERCV